MTDRDDSPVARALDLARSVALVTPTQDVSVPETAGRILAEDVVAERDLPPAESSSMDGWAVRAADTPGVLAVAGESAAGQPSDRRLAPGEAMAISTGANLPGGADAVARREIASVEGGRVRIAETVDAGRDVRRRGETIRAGATLLPAGHRVAPHEVGALGAIGRASVRCHRRPRVAILATGAELVPLGTPVRSSQVHDASRHGIAAQAGAAGGVVVASASVGDDMEATVAALAAMLDAAGDHQPDLLVTNGGISAGPHDLVRPALARLGVEQLLGGVRASPVWPTYLGRRGDQLVLGLPGNPASAAVAFHLLGRPLLGVDDDWWRRAPLAVAAKRHPGRAELIRCVEGPDGLTPLKDQASHSVASLTGATALAWIGEEDSGEEGTVVAFSRFG